MSLGEAISEGSSVEKILLHLNGNSNDDSGNSLNGTDTNITYGKQYGKFNDGALFNGSNSKISIPNNSILQFSNNFTISLYVYILNTATQTNFISKTFIGSTYSGFHIGKEPNGRIRFVTYTEKTFKIAYSKLSTTAYDNKWSRIDCTLGNSEMKLYINGELQETTTGVIMRANTTLPLYLGALEGAAWWFNGYIDEVRIRTRVLTQQEIQKEYTNSLGRFAIL